MQQKTDNLLRSPLLWKLFFGLKLIFGLIIAGIFYFENSNIVFWGLSFVIFSVVAFFIVYRFYAKMKKQNLLFHLLILDFLVSASYGYVFIGGEIPNYLFVGITALAILMFIKNTRILILACVLLMLFLVVTMGIIDWYLNKRLDEAGYFIACSFIIFACIVTVLINFYQRARRDTLQLYAQLKQSHVQLQENALKAEEWATARERVRIAREIHDTVGHKLTALLVQMQVARKISTIDPIRGEQSYLECEGLIRSSLQEVRLSVRAIRDEPIKSTFLNDSLEKLSEEFTKYAQVHTDFKVVGIPVAIPSNLQLTAYRIAQESLTNAQKHGDANHAEISLSYSDNGFFLCVSNDGKVPDELKPGFGLISLQERVKEWNGEVHFRMDPIKGFAVEVEFPYSLIDAEREMN
ncbi:sensor histidine kinase [Bacillus sp. FJAT-26390]|uniref:sensor histidine kinase n=1 Tax=Bacillus sp. FJAT-26390 TaxID=1743142 RepID=UPI000807D050|nr:sensor histidine kinase [Bacillus sp. FJAT-26390]OBZ15766.1 histidine kinase [Bacillus sp. FJAT-26390]